jgi:hypothetical protein
MSSGSWKAFAGALEEENRCLGELGAASLAMTSALVFGDAAQIEAADRTVDLNRVALTRAHSRRSIMMKSGFGDLTLRQVCGYAPASARRAVFASLHELRTRGIALQITVANNRALIGAGLERIAKTIDVMQSTLSERTGTYRRRGNVPKPNESLIMSRKA